MDHKVIFISYKVESGHGGVYKVDKDYHEPISLSPVQK